jgi:hypothetical protein
MITIIGGATGLFSDIYNRTWTPNDLRGEQSFKPRLGNCATYAKASQGCASQAEAQAMCFMQLSRLWVK